MAGGVQINAHGTEGLRAAQTPRLHPTCLDGSIETCFIQPRALDLRPDSSTEPSRIFFGSALGCLPETRPSDVSARLSPGVGRRAGCGRDAGPAEPSGPEPEDAGQADALRVWNGPCRGCSWPV